jgi:transcriptional regulator with XRE-family HTH domain/tetratricopeptide (TPR) repeat protein
MRAQGRGIDEIADEIRSLCGTSRLAAYRMAHGLSQPEVVDRFLAATDGAFLDQPTLSRLEQFPSRSSRAPLAAHLVPLAAIFGTTPLRLLSTEALGRLDARERELLLRWGSTLGAARRSAVEFAPGSDVGGVPDHDRRTVDHSLEGQVAMAARRAFHFAAGAEGSNVGPETMAEIQHEVRRLAAAYPQQPLQTLLGDLIQVQDVTFRLLEGRQPPAHTRELNLMAGITSGMLAKASHDLGDARSAMTQARAAYICADTADHDSLRAWVRGLQSLIAYWAGWPNEALRFARIGADSAGGSGTARIWIASLEARAWALFGNAEQARKAIERADDLREITEGDDLDAIGGILTFGRPRQLYYAADALAWLPEQRRAAEQRALDAVEAYEAADPSQRSFGDEAGARTDLAVARVRLGDMDGARVALDEVLELPAGQRINGVVASTQRVHSALREAATSGSVQARELQEEIESFAQVSAALVRR